MNRKNALLTGASGFLGRHFSDALIAADFNLKTLGRGAGNDYQYDLSQTIPDLKMPFDMVLHNAGKAHVVPRTAAEETAFFQVNYQGSLNLLASLDKIASKPRQFIFISTVAVYGKEKGGNIAETHPLESITPYGKSKIMAEKAVQEWCGKYGVPCLILRLPLVAGKNPPGNLGAIASAIRSGYYFKIKGNTARKSMVLAEDVAQLTSRLENKDGIFNLTDGAHPAFTEIELALEKVMKKNVRFSMPLGLVKSMAKMGDKIRQIGLSAPLTSDMLEKITATLTFNDEKARNELDWQSRPVTSWILEHF